VARQLLANDEVDFDFDMWIDKAPRTDTPTPWHCDMAYWMELPDKDAVSCWLAIDPATVDNGCMWFVPGSHREPVRPHKQAAEGSRALQCECSEAEGVAVPLEPGSCTFHHAGTLHYSRGNTTASHRRAMITNFRSIEMIEYERAHDFDHGRKTSAG
jgi:ectoine hydroxylase-related dioxygenase (phytanoyl-CoA dioxygenase family)